MRPLAPPGESSDGLGWVCGETTWAEWIFCWSVWGLRGIGRAAEVDGATDGASVRGMGEGDGTVERRGAEELFGRCGCPGGADRFFNEWVPWCRTTGYWLLVVAGSCGFCILCGSSKYSMEGS